MELTFSLIVVFAHNWWLESKTLSAKGRRIWHAVAVNRLLLSFYVQARVFFAAAVNSLVLKFQGQARVSFAAAVNRLVLKFQVQACVFFRPLGSPQEI